MNVLHVIIGVVSVIAIYLLYRHFFVNKNDKTLISYHDAKVGTSVSGSSLPGNTSTDFTYSTWIYVNDWNYRYGEKKVIFEHATKDGAPVPLVYLDSMTNNLMVQVGSHLSREYTSQELSRIELDDINTIYSDTATNTTSSDDAAFKKMGQFVSDIYTKSTDNNKNNFNIEQSTDMLFKTNTCSIENIPLQRWTNIILTVNNKALDIYLDGKLVKTCILDNVPLTSDSNILVCPDGGFSGYISNFRYLSNAINPTQAYNIYKDGYSGSSVGGLLSQYKVKIAFVENNKEVNSVEL